jgi:hypothetical protein
MINHGLVRSYHSIEGNKQKKAVPLVMKEKRVHSRVLSSRESSANLSLTKEHFKI